jgi:hypothetical protein
MTTQTTTIRTSKQGARVLFGATAITLTLLGGALLWQMRPLNQPAASSGTTTSAIDESATPLGGLAEQYQDQAQMAAAATQVTPRGGMAELYADQAVPMTDQEMVAALGFSDSMSEATRPMGGMAEMYRDQELDMASAGAERTESRCGLDALSNAC